MWQATTPSGHRRAGGMPLIGLALGSALARGIGHAANYLAAAAVIGIGG